MRLIDLGSDRNYQEIFDLQWNLVKMRQEKKTDDTILFLEHSKVITIGNSGKEENIHFSEEFLKDLGFSIHHINRGGDVTYHGPGQLVGYFIVKISEFSSGVREFFWMLEEIFISFLRDEYNILGSRDEDHPGVWVGENKITALGCAIKKGVSMHGFAFNVNTDLNDFNYITPCGIVGKGVTSLEREVGRKLDFNEVKDKLRRTIMKVFKSELVYCEEKIMNLEIKEWKKENLNG